MGFFDIQMFLVIHYLFPSLDTRKLELISIEFSDFCLQFLVSKIEAGVQNHCFFLITRKFYSAFVISVTIF